MTVREPATKPPAAEPGARARRSPVQERSQETVQRIFAGAAVLLGRGQPLEEVTTAMIAAEAGVSVGALYRFFPDKQAIVDAIAMRHMETFQKGLTTQIAAAAPKDGPGLLSAVIEAFYLYLEANPDFVTVAYGAQGGGRYVSRPARDAYAAPDCRRRLAGPLVHDRGTRHRHAGCARLEAQDRDRDRRPVAGIRLRTAGQG
ncbi:MAG: TetR/AcrR family transcriptional regulator [Aliidongia sp.]